MYIPPAEHRGVQHDLGRDGDARERQRGRRGGRRAGGKLHTEHAADHDEADGREQVVHGGCETGGWQREGERQLTQSVTESQPAGLVVAGKEEAVPAAVAGKKAGGKEAAAVNSEAVGKEAVVVVPSNAARPPRPRFTHTRAPSSTRRFRCNNNEKAVLRYKHQVLQQTLSHAPVKETAGFTAGARRENCTRHAAGASPAAAAR